MIIIIHVLIVTNITESIIQS